MTTPPPEATDGRKARAERGRTAAIDAMIDLVQETGATPTAEQVAERAGVSMSSLFRYFENLGDLQRETAVRFFQRHAGLFELPNEGKGPLPRRIDALVNQRLLLFQTIAPVSRIGRSRAVDNLDLAAVLLASRRGLAEQVARQFAPELAERTPAAAEDLAALLSGILSIESWEHHRLERERTDAQTRRAWKLAITTLLAS